MYVSTKDDFLPFNSEISLIEFIESNCPVFFNSIVLFLFSGFIVYLIIKCINPQHVRLKNSLKLL